VPCPVPSHGKGRGDRNPSLRLTDGQTQLLVRCYSGCDARDVLDVLRRRGLLNFQNGARLECNHRPVAAQNGGGRKREDDGRARKQWAREIWHAARDPRGTLVEYYLRSRRLKLDDNLAGRVLRFLHRCPWLSESGERVFLPALIVPFRSIDDNTITAIHRIRLDQPERWPKAERRMLGVVHRAAVKLDSEVGDVLAIGEGVETCMAARQLDIGVGPAWALGSAGGIERFPVLPNIRTLRILAENDSANEAAREQCGLRWRAAGRNVRVTRPTDDAKDFNDVLEG
ncbi:MAG TPA: toprim domain-containing protein, partial [Candidatus Cybelea sp.]|nr:toprim domain-containing protein [Candidatus Cybelea sp.]